MKRAIITVVLSNVGLIAICALALRAAFMERDDGYNYLHIVYAHFLDCFCTLVFLALPQTRGGLPYKSS